MFIDPAHRLIPWRIGVVQMTVIGVVQIIMMGVVHLVRAGLTLSIVQMIYVRTRGYVF